MPGAQPRRAAHRSDHQRARRLDDHGDQRVADPGADRALPRLRARHATRWSTPSSSFPSVSYVWQEERGAAPRWSSCLRPTGSTSASIASSRPSTSAPWSCRSRTCCSAPRDRGGGADRRPRQGGRRDGASSTATSRRARCPFDVQALGRRLRLRRLGEVAVRRTRRGVSVRAARSHPAVLAAQHRLVRPRKPFAFTMPEQHYASSVWRYMAGTPAIAALYQARAGVEIIGEIGVERIRAKSLRQTRRIIWSLRRGRLPRQHAARGRSVAAAPSASTSTAPSGVAEALNATGYSLRLATALAASASRRTSTPATRRSSASWTRSRDSGRSSRGR